MLFHIFTIQIKVKV